jgi:hypothetical protein
MLVFQIAVLGGNLLLATLPSSEQLSNAGFAAQPLARQIPAALNEGRWKDAYTDFMRRAGIWMPQTHRR